MRKNLRFVGLDVHKESIAVAVADSGREPATLLETIPNDWMALLKVLDRLAPRARLRVCHEAGPTGYPDSSIVALVAEDGVDMLERLQKTFNFGDGEDAIIEFSVKELRAGHYALGIQAKDRAAAVQVVNLLEPLGAHSFSYFGTWVNERLTR